MKDLSKSWTEYGPASRADKYLGRNPFNIKHPQWKHWALGVLVFRGALTAEQVVSWEADSPASLAYWRGHEAARQAEALLAEEQDQHDKLWNPIQSHINANRVEGNQ